MALQANVRYPDSRALIATILDSGRRQFSWPLSA
jgi:hypothetical protein